MVTFMDGLTCIGMGIAFVADLYTDLMACNAHDAHAVLVAATGHVDFEGAYR